MSIKSKEKHRAKKTVKAAPRALHTEIQTLPGALSGGTVAPQRGL